MMTFRLFICSTGILLASAAAIGCANVPKNRSDGHLPPNMECVTPTDPQCTGMATVSGQCELEIQGRPGVFPCTGIKLIVKSVGPTDSQERTAEISGSTFRFLGLSGGNYRVHAESDTYDVQTDENDALKPGQTVKIRVKAKPRP